MFPYEEISREDTTKAFTLPSTVITILANNKWQSIHLARIGSIRSASKFLIKCSNNLSQVAAEEQSPRAETKWEINELIIPIIEITSVFVISLFRFR